MKREYLPLQLLISDLKFTTVFLLYSTENRPSRSSLHFIENKYLLPRLQVPATCPYPEPDQSCPCSPSHFLKIHLNIILRSNHFLTSQEILCILQNLKAHYFMYKSLPLVPILSQINPVHAPHFNSLRSILVLSSHLCLGLPSGLFP